MSASARYHRRRRATLLARLGSACAHCRTQSGPLHVDHVYNNGVQARSTRGNAGEISYMLALPQPALRAYAQLLCVPCHDAKTWAAK